MNSIPFGHTGISVTALGMGGMRFGKEMSEKDAVGVVRYACDRGVTYFDTAPGYCDDRSESIYGKALERAPYRSAVLATKGFNTKSGDEINAAIENSLRKLKRDHIDLYFLWCVMNPEQYAAAKAPSRSLEAILKAKERGLIGHIGVSTHMDSDGIRSIVDDGIFEFIMGPYNAINHRQRDDGLRYARERGMATVAMNPLHGGVIAQYKDAPLFGSSDTIASSMRFCLSSPAITVTLSGMNSKAQVDENISYTERQDAVRAYLREDLARELCTACGYCLEECPAAINIPAFMDAYNIFRITGAKAAGKDKLAWQKKFGLLSNDAKAAADCTACGACERKCTQFLNIIERMKWLSGMEKEILSEQKKS
ncbi:MAG: aldo/keto reductase [Spirochaetota bacterium]